MGTMQQAFLSVDLKPTGLRARLLNNAKQKKETPRPMGVVIESPITLATVIDGVIDPITKPRVVQVQRAGGYFRARFEGEAVSTFGATRKEATANLKFFAKVLR